MKKPLITTMIMLLGLSACQKEAQDANTASNTQNSTMPNKKSSGNDVTQSPLVPMVLIPRQAGQNYDTYQAIYNGVGVQVTGPLSYNTTMYPTIVTGIPVFGTSMSTYGPYAWIDYYNSGNDGNVFEVTVPTLGGLPSTGFTSDIDTYFTNYSNWANSGEVGAAPTLAVSVGTTYSGNGNALYYTGKLVLTTTGSGLAIAPVTYALPTPAKPPIGNFTTIITDPSISTVSYQLNGVNSAFISGLQGAYNGTTTNFTNSKSVIVSGDYVSLGSGTYHIWGSVIRPDGSSFNFNITQSFD